MIGRTLGHIEISLTSKSHYKLQAYDIFCGQAGLHEGVL